VGVFRAQTPNVPIERPRNVTVTGGTHLRHVRFGQVVAGLPFQRLCRCGSDGSGKKGADSQNAKDRFAVLKSEGFIAKKTDSPSGSRVVHAFLRRLDSVEPDRPGSLLTSSNCG